MSNPKDYRTTWEEQYQRLAHKFSQCLKYSRGTVAEIGCGTGRLTVPLATLTPKLIFNVVDRFAGSYSSDRKQLLSSLAKHDLQDRVRVFVNDFKAWLEEQQKGEYSAVLSNEFLPEIDKAQVDYLMHQCFRILEPNGSVVHGFRPPTPKNDKQKLLIEADSDPQWTRTPPAEWFSPTTKIVTENMSRAGFRDVKVLRLKAGLILKQEAAKALLRDWDVKKIFWNSHREALMRDGLEIPDWVIVVGWKSNRPA